MQKKHQSLIFVFFGIAIVLMVLLSFLLYGKISGKIYYFSMALAIVAMAIIPFFISFEKRVPSSREIAVTAAMTALAVASRAAFYALPAIKPMCAIVIITAVSFGPFTGFICGALSAFMSDFIFGQGVWTPFQMLGMGAVGFLAGLIFCGRKIALNRFILAIGGGLLCFVVYGLIVDVSSVLTMSAEYTLRQVLSVYASGVPFNLVHGAVTAVVLLIAGQNMTLKLDRIRIKYGLFGGKNE